MLETGADPFENLLLLCSSKQLEDAVKFADKNIVSIQPLSSGFLSRFFNIASSVLEKDNSTLSFFQKILYTVTERCKYDDIVFELVDAAADNSNVYIFELTLGSFKILFMRQKNDLYFEWCLSSIRSNVENVCLDPKNVGRCWDTLLSFINDIINIYKPFSENSKHAILSTALYLNRSMYPTVHVKELMRYIAKLTPDPFNLIPVIEYCFKDKNDMQNKSILQYYESVKKSSFASFMYIALTENPMLPQVYSSYYRFEISLLVANKLFEGKSRDQIQGLQLLSDNSLSCRQSLTHSQITPAVKRALKSMGEQMVYSGDIEIRKSAFKEFDALIEAFDVKGQYYLILKIGPFRSHHNKRFSINASDKGDQDDQHEKNVREKILNASLPFVQQYGWSTQTLAEGAKAIGYPGVTSGLFQNGPADLIFFFYVNCNKELIKSLEQNTPTTEVKIEPRIIVEKAIKSRLEMIVPYLNHWPEALGILSLPRNVPIALSNLLTLVDDICHHAGDRSVDFNWYTRRIAVGGIYKMTELSLIQDKSDGFVNTWDFLHRRMDEAMNIHSLLQTSGEASNIARDAVLATFTTARNILRLNQIR